ncbi:MAG: hypothetical protein HQL30_04840 [Candidatus Omnitrophica bacterium]|nr:hypothetical protein [Candidatus Omnitrophota bacterium]
MGSELLNVGMFPDNVKKALVPYVLAMLDSFKGGVVSVFAYGSVTGADYDPKRSDINLAFVLADNSMKKLLPASKCILSGLKKRINVPLFITPEYIRMSLDSFPVEFTEMKESRVVLFGKDILNDIEVRKEDLRRECEYQIKGKLLTLRQACLEMSGKAKDIDRLLKSALKGLFPVFRSLVRLKNAGVAGRGRREVLSRIGEIYGLDISVFVKILDGAATGCKPGPGDASRRMDDFFDVLNKISVLIDEIKI